MKIKNKNNKKFNVYCYPKNQFIYYLKVIFIYILLKIVNVYKLLQVQYILAKIGSEKYYEQLERPHKLSNHDKPIDGVYFNAANKDGDHLVIGTARRKQYNDEAIIDGFIYLKINNGEIGLLQTPKLPDTTLFQTPPRDEFSAEGIKVECIVPMKKWSVFYEGKMKRGNDEFNVSIRAFFFSDLPYFNFDLHTDCWSIAKCIAVEEWSREFFERMKTEHQTHYEQQGFLKGTATINGRDYPIRMECMRDHTFGDHREWGNLHKYNLQLFATENGDRFNVGNISFPLTLSNIKAGYMYSAQDQKIHPITYNDFELYQHGESGIPPMDYAFTIKAGDKTYVVQVLVTDSPYFFISKDWESKVIERLCNFKVNGLKGWGASEWECRNSAGRNVVTSNC